MRAKQSNTGPASGKRRLGAVLLLVLCCLVLIACAAFLLPHLLRAPKQAALPAASPSPAAVEAEVPAAPAPVVCELRAFSSGGDLYAVLRDAEGNPVKEDKLSFEIVFPDGTVSSYPAGDDGTLYLGGMESGLYTVRLLAPAHISALPAAISVPAVSTDVSVFPSSDPGWRESDGKLYYVNARGNAVTGMHQIDGKLRYFDQYGVKASALGLDVSYHNKGINWPAVKAQGIDFVILRAGYRGYSTGLLWEDQRFVQYLKGAKAVGLDVGVYFYSSAVNPAEAVQEASFVIGLLGGTELEYPVYFDTELSEDIPPGRHDYLGKAVRQQVIPAFCETIRAAGYTPGVYSNLNFLNNHIPYSCYGPYTTWLASYTRDNRRPSFDRPYDMWQFTAGGVVNGIRGVADLNVVF